MTGIEISEGPWELSTFSMPLAGTRRPSAGGEAADESARAQQHRVLQAVLSIASVSGYASLSMSLILRTAGVPRRGFNTWFASPEDAFVAAHDQCMDQLVDAVRAATAVDGVPEHQLRQGLQAAVDYLVADPARADALLMQVHAAGHRAQRSQEVAVQELISEAHGVLVRSGLDEPVARRLARLGIGALREAIRTRMARGELHRLPTVVSELADAAFPLRALGRSDRCPEGVSTSMSPA